jgi:hypothetical protein
MAPVRCYKLVPAPVDLQTLEAHGRLLGIEKQIEYSTARALKLQVYDVAIGRLSQDPRAGSMNERFGSGGSGVSRRWKTSKKNVTDGSLRESPKHGATPSAIAILSTVNAESEKWRPRPLRLIQSARLIWSPSPGAESE